jgi:hypothetical protein
MLGFRIRDLDAMLAPLRARGTEVAEEPREMEGVGRPGGSPAPRRRPT